MPLPDFLEPIGEVVTTLRDLLPSKGWWKRPRFNFITLHYFYLIGMTIIGSLMLFAGGLDYVDSIFFTGGAATQSGLNTVDVNTLFLYQQIVLMLLACLCTPVFINTVVVFVRLYWFEKRFKHIVEDARDTRKTWEKSRSKSEAKSLPDISNVERGVNGRSITVLHDTTRPNGMSASNSHTKEEAARFSEQMGLNEEQGSNEKQIGGSEDETLTNADLTDESEPSAPSQRSTADERELPAPLRRTITDEAPASLHRNSTDESEPPAALQRTITFTDELPAPSPPEISQHIAILQRQQQNAKAEGGTLRIPGPRDYDRGELPEEIHDDSAAAELQRRLTRDSIDTSKTPRRPSHGSAKEAPRQGVRPGITFNEPQHRPQHGQHADDDAEIRSEKSGVSRLAHMRLRAKKSGVEMGDRKSTFARTFTSLSKTFTQAKSDAEMPYLSWQATIGRNSAFVNLTAAQREELGGIEYRALKLLAKILICYYVGFHLFGLLVYLPWILTTQPWRGIVESDGASAGWWGVFTAASMFNDLGLTLTPDSMNSFESATLILLVGSFLIIIGNTGFPVMLRFLIWLLSKFTTKGSPMSDELHFLLDHPRRCFTLLFPSRANWWLFWILILLNSIDLLFFIILDLDDPTVTDLAPGYRVLNGWFQATSTRTAGFSSVDIADLHPAIQVSYMIMMYISVLPIAISVRRTNVYEEKSLGIWGGEHEQSGAEDTSYVGQHLRNQLSFDLWYIFLGFFIISIVEGPRLAALDDPAFSMFAILFEIVSAYGTVGLSLGYPTINASFSAELHALSKLVILAMMIRGRHRGLPYALDRAILLPSEKQYSKEAEDADRRYERRNSVYQTEFDRSKTWSDGDIDENGLPRQHISSMDPMTAAAGGERTSNMDRRASTASNLSRNPAPGRPRPKRKTIGTVLSMGLSAGPTWHKDD